MKVNIKSSNIIEKEYTRDEIDRNLYLITSLDLADFLCGVNQAQHRDEARILLVEAFKDANVKLSILECVKKLYLNKDIGFSYEEESRYNSK